MRGAGPGLSGAGDNGRGSARAPPPSPLPPPPAAAAAAAAAAPAASSPRYCCKSSFLPPTLCSRAPREPPALPGRERLRGGRSAGRRARSARPARAPGPVVRKCRPRLNHGVHAWGRGTPSFREALTWGWAGLAPFPERPLPGLFRASRGRGHTQPLGAFAESQLSQWKGPRNPVIGVPHFTVGSVEAQREGGPPRSHSLEAEP